MMTGGSRQTSPPVFDLSGMEGLVPQFSRGDTDYSSQHALPPNGSMVYTGFPSHHQMTVKTELVVCKSDNQIMSEVMFGRINCSDLDSDPNVF
jgi:hypothetical protein